MDQLRAAGLLYFFGWGFHNIDHMRRGFDVLTRHVFWGGIATGIMSAIALFLIATRHEKAPQVAVVTGFFLAVAFTAAHLLPYWSAFSDSFPSGTNVSWMSWTAAITEVTCATILGIAGLRELRSQPERQRHPGKLAAQT